MMKALLRLVCAWRGHDLVNTTGEWHCLYCGSELSYDQVVTNSIKSRLIVWFGRRKDWWKCSDCGGRFGKHDDTPHLPF